MPLSKIAAFFLVSMVSVVAAPTVIDFSKYKVGDKLQDGEDIKGSSGDLEFRGEVPDWVRDEKLFAKGEIVAEGNAKTLILEASGNEGVFPWAILRTSDTFNLGELRRDLKFVVEFKVLELGEGNGSGMGLFAVDAEDGNTGSFDVLKSDYTALALRWGAASGFSLMRSIAGTEQSYWGGEWHDQAGGVFLSAEKGLDRKLRATFKVSATAKTISFSLHDMDADAALLRDIVVPLSEMSDAVKASEIRFNFGKFMNNSVPTTRIQVFKVEAICDK